MLRSASVCSPSTVRANSCIALRSPRAVGTRDSAAGGVRAYAAGQVGAGHSPDQLAHAVDHLTHRKRESCALAVSVFAAFATATVLTAAAPGAWAVSGGGGISTPLSYEDLSNKDLTKMKYTKAVLRQTNFNGSNLSGVSLFGALAKGATFAGANLTGADLESADFEDADFTNAVLEGAYVNNAQFVNVKLQGSDWSDVDLRKDVRKSLCKIADGVNPQTGVSTRESLGCD